MPDVGQGIADNPIVVECQLLHIFKSNPAGSMTVQIFIQRTVYLD